MCSTCTDDEVGACARDIVPAVQAWKRHLPIDEVGVVEDVALLVIVVELLRGQDNGDLRVVQLSQDLDEEVAIAHHVRIKDDHQLQTDTVLGYT